MRAVQLKALALAAALAVAALGACSAASAGPRAGGHEGDAAEDQPLYGDDEHGGDVEGGAFEGDFTHTPGGGGADGQDCVGGVCEVLSEFQKAFASVLKPETYEPSVLVVGVVADDARTLPYWDAVRAHAEANGVPLEYIAYSSYERLVMAAFHGHFHLGWFSPLAMVEVRRMAAAYGFRPRVVASAGGRDAWTRSVCVAPAGSAVAAPKDLKGKTVAVGAADSAKATLLPLARLAELSGLALGDDIAVKRHDVALGAHGLGAGLAAERAAAAAVAAGEADAACFGEADLAALQKEGLLKGAAVIATTEPAAGHALAVLDGHEGAVADLVAKFEAATVNATAEVNAQTTAQAARDAAPGAPLVAGVDEGYDALAAVVKEFRFLDRWLESLGASGDLSGMGGHEDYPPGMMGHDDADGPDPYTFGDMDFDGMTEEEKKAFFGGEFPEDEGDFGNFADDGTHDDEPNVKVMHGDE